MSELAPIVKSAAVEAKKYALRQSKDGVIVSFVLHPQDMNEIVTLAPIGQRGMLVFVPIDDEENPIVSNVVPHSGPLNQTGNATGDAEDADRHTIDPVKSARSKAAYAGSTPAEQAISRAAILCADKTFVAWVHWIAPSAKTYADIPTWLRAATLVNSRREYATNENALQRFLDIEDQFNRASSRTADPRC